MATQWPNKSERPQKARKTQQLAGKVAVITGASRGLGLELAREFVRQGARVVMSDIAHDELHRVAAELGAQAYIADVTNEQAMFELAAFTKRTFGSLDLWVNNAGLWMPHCPIEQMSLDRVHRMVEVNLFGIIHGARAALAVMKPVRTGIIINILSTSALIGRPGSSGYCASKCAAMGFCKSLALEVADDGIVVYNIYPEGMQTKLFDEQRPEDYKDYLDPCVVAMKIMKNLSAKKPKGELVIRRAKQKY